MQTNPETQNNTNPLERRIELALAIADVDKDVDARLKRLARTVKMPGFRPGKVPFKMVAQQHGPQVRHEAIGEAVERVFLEAVQSQNLRVAGYPRIEARPEEDVSKLGFSAIFEVYPEVVLGDISAQEIVRPVLEVTDAEVDKTLDVLKKQRTTFARAERAAEEGDRVVIDFTGRLDGEVFQGGEAKDFGVVLGQGQMLPDFEAAVKGLSAGEGKTFDMTFPADYHAAHLAGKTVSFDITVNAVEAPQLPEVDAEFARSLGIADGDVEKMRAEVKGNLEREVKKRILGRVKEQAMNAVLAATPITVPQVLIDSESRNMAEAAKGDLAARGMDVSKVPVQPAWFVEQATRRVKLGLIVAEIVKEKELKSAPEQVRAQVEEFAQSYEDPQDVVDWYFSQPQRLAEVQALVLENNVVDWVLANARTSDKVVSFDELMGTGA